MNSSDPCIGRSDPGDITLTLEDVYPSTVQGANDEGTGPYTFTLAEP